MNGWILTSGAFLEEARRYYGDFESKLKNAKLVHCADVAYTVETGTGGGLWLNNTPCETPDFFVLFDSVSEPVAALARELTRRGSYCYTSMEGKRRAASKVATNQAMASAGVPVAKTLIITRKTDPQLVLDTLGLPFVSKPDDGSGAIDVNLVHTEEELRSLLDGLDDTRVMLAQEFIATSRGRDLRVQIIGGKAAFAMEKGTKDPNDFRSYVKGIGGTITDVELTDDLKELAAKVAGVIGLRYCGIDFLYGPDGLILGEVNSSPGIRASMFEQVMTTLLADIAKGLREFRENNKG